MLSVKVSPKYQVVIPKEIRESLVATKRAGADAILTYFAKYAAQQLTSQTVHN